VLNMCDLFEDDYKEFVLGELTERRVFPFCRSRHQMELCRKFKVRNSGWNRSEK